MNLTDNELRQLNPDDGPLRDTGRTTALMLHAIANALEHPDETVEFRDHLKMTFGRACEMLVVLRRKIHNLNLTIDTAMAKDKLNGTTPEGGMFA